MEGVDLIPPSLWIKGSPKRRWARHKKLVECVFTRLFPNWTKSTITIAIQAGLPKSTVYDWKACWEKDKAWRPYNTRRSLDKRLFTDEEEANIASCTIEGYIAQGCYFTDEDFQKVAVKAWIAKKGKGQPQFSKRMISGFKRRTGFISRLAHPKRRPIGLTQASMDAWKAHLCNLLKGTPPDRIINVDETAWQPLPNNLRTWAVRGSKCVQIRTQSNEKLRMTAICAITAERTKPPMHLIVKGRSRRSLDALGDTSPHRCCVTESGWITQPLFCEWLMWLRQTYGTDDKLYLILDCYSIHKEEAIRTISQTLNIELIFVPPGATDELQPLDRYVFGTMKGVAERKWRQLYEIGEKEKFGKTEMAQIAIASWEAVGPRALEKAWEILDTDEQEDGAVIDLYQGEEEEDDYDPELGD